MRRSSTTLSFLALLALTAPARSQTVVLHPGGVHLFGAPTGIDGSYDVSLGPFSGPATAVLGTTLPPDSPLQSFVCASRRLSRARGEIHRFNDFVLDSTWGSETVIAGRVSGTVDVRGFLLLIGVGESKAEVVVELLDITDPAAPLVVNCKEISKHEVSSSMDPSVEVDLEIEGGAPYVGGGLGIGTGNMIHYKMKKVRDSVSFGFDAMLRRGHSYRVVVKCKSESMLTAAGLGIGAAPLGGKAIACFFAPEDLANPDVLVPNLLSNHFDRLTEIVALLKLPSDGALSNIPLLNLTDSDDLPELVQQIVDFLSFSIRSQGDTIRAMLESKFGIVLPDNPDLCNLASQFFDFADRLLGEEQIDSPGVTTTRLLVSIAQDPIELAERQQIESGLVDQRPMVTHILPLEFGGQLERVFLLVDERITQMALAGLPTNNAPFFMNLARNELAEHDYRTAYARAGTAYRLLSQQN